MPCSVPLSPYAPDAWFRCTIFLSCCCNCVGGACGSSEWVARAGRAGAGHERLPSAAPPPAVRQQPLPRRRGVDGEHARCVLEDGGWRVGLEDRGGR
eukprot:1378625-Rhodomonas_salina.1